MSRADDAIMRLYEDPALRDDLIDDEAEALLHWAEAEIARLDATAPDDAAFEAGVDALFTLTGDINHAAGSVGQLRAQSVDYAPKIATDAEALGYSVEPAIVQAALAQPDPMSAVRALTAAITGQTFDAHTADASVSAAAPPPSSLPPESILDDLEHTPPRTIVPPSDDFMPLSTPGEDD